jgi:transcriptional regulator with XRE-family HTH domain
VLDYTVPAMTLLRSALGLAIRRLRSEAGYSQEAFASRCGVHRTYMTSVERGRRNVSLDTIERIAKALRIDTGELLAEAEKERRGGKSSLR